MTNERVGSFVSDLVEMAKAVEQVPVLETQIASLQELHDFEVSRNSSLLHDLDQARIYAASLEQRCHDLEVSRDAAELRFLESDDAVGTLKRAMRIAMGEVDSALQAVEPPKPEPVPEPMATNVDFPLPDGPLLYAGGGDGSFNENDGPLAPLDDDRMSPNYRGTEVSEVPTDPTNVDTEGQSSIAASTTETIAAPTTSTEEAPADATSDPTASSSPTPTSPNAPPVNGSEGAASGSSRRSWGDADDFVF